MALLGDAEEAGRAVAEGFAQAALAPSASVASSRGTIFAHVRAACARRLEARPRATVKTMPSPGRSNDLGDAAKARAELAGLRPSERDVIVLRFVAELTLDEVAESCRIDRAEASARIARAMASIAKTI
jgi:DNA-directed RNA polymerase specialized sigma24 family protein